MRIGNPIRLVLGRRSTQEDSANIRNFTTNSNGAAIVFPDTCSLLQLAAKDARSDLETDQDPRIHWLAPVFLACLGLGMLGLGGEWFTSRWF